MLRIRKVKTKSGSIAIQVVQYTGHSAKIVKHIASAKDEIERDLLITMAQEWIGKYTLQSNLFPEQKQALVLITFTWVYKAGIYLDTLCPIKIKNHGRRAKSLLKYGLNYIANLLFSNDIDKLTNVVNFCHVLRSGLYILTDCIYTLTLSNFVIRKS